MSNLSSYPKSLRIVFTSDSVNPNLSSDLLENTLFTTTLFRSENMLCAICITPVMHTIRLLGLDFRAEHRKPPRKFTILRWDSLPKLSDTARSYSSIRITGLAPLALAISAERFLMDVLRKSSWMSLLSRCSKSSLTAGSRSGLSRRYLWGSKASLTASRILLM